MPIVNEDEVMEFLKSLNIKTSSTDYLVPLVSQYAEDYIIKLLDNAATLAQHRYNKKMTRSDLDFAIRYMI